MCWLGHASATLSKQVQNNPTVFHHHHHSSRMWAGEKEQDHPTSRMVLYPAQHSSNSGMVGGWQKAFPNTSWGARYKKIQYIFWPYMKYLYLLISSQYSIFKLFPCLPLLLQICADGIRFYSKKQQTPADSLEIIQYTDMLKWWMDGYVRDGDKKCIKNWSWYVFSLSPRATLTTPVQIATRHLIWMWRRVKRRSCSRMEKPAT